nr:phage tail family protein [Bacillus subtilis]
MHLIIIKNGETIDHRNFGLRLLSFRKDSLTHRTDLQEVDGRNGSIDMGTTFDVRKLTAVFLFKGVDHIDYHLLLDEVYDLFATQNEMEIIDSRQPGKVWSVKVSKDVRTGRHHAEERKTYGRVYGRFSFCGFVRLNTRPVNV